MKKTNLTIALEMVSRVRKDLEKAIHEDRLYRVKYDLYLTLIPYGKSHSGQRQQGRRKELCLVWATREHGYFALDKYRIRWLAFDSPSEEEDIARLEKKLTNNRKDEAREVIRATHRWLSRLDKKSPTYIAGALLFGDELIDPDSLRLMLDAGWVERIRTKEEGGRKNMKYEASKINEALADGALFVVNYDIYSTVIACDDVNAPVIPSEKWHSDSCFIWATRNNGFFAEYSDGSMWLGLDSPTEKEDIAKVKKHLSGERKAKALRIIRAIHRWLRQLPECFPLMRAGEIVPGIELDADALLLMWEAGWLDLIKKRSRGNRKPSPAARKKRPGKEKG